MWSGTKAASKPTTLKGLRPGGLGSGRARLGDDVALQRAAAVAAVCRGPGHADPAALAELAAELARHREPGIDPRAEAAGGALPVEELAHLGAQRGRGRRQLGRRETG